MTDEQNDTIRNRAFTFSMSWFQNEKCSVPRFKCLTEDKWSFLIKCAYVIAKDITIFPSEFLCSLVYISHIVSRFGNRVAFPNNRRDMSSIIVIIRMHFWFCIIRFFANQAQIQRVTFRDARHAIAFRDDNLFSPFSFAISEITQRKGAMYMLPFLSLLFHFPLSLYFSLIFFTYSSSW